MRTETYQQIIAKWWDAFSKRSQTRGNIAGGLVLLENLRTNLSFEMEQHKTSGSDQLRNATPSNVANILARYGEHRTLSKEAGRTNRGLVKNLTPLLAALGGSEISQLSPEEREQAIEAMQSFLVDRAKDIFNANRISFDYDPGGSSRQIISRILQAAKERQKSGEVAEYLVGAKLALRFPLHDIRNSPASAADEQAHQQGDFQINDCIFHVTVAPNLGHYAKCRSNIVNGFRVFLLVTDDKLTGARQIAELEIGDGISVESIQSFVSQNIEELSEFAGKRVAQSVRRLLEKYNERVSQVETDLSLRIKIPASLGN